MNYETHDGVVVTNGVFNLRLGSEIVDGFAESNWVGSQGWDNRGNALATILAVIVAPIAAMIVQMAISRTREFGADKAGAEISGNPMALASALAKISRGAQAIPNPVSERMPAAAQLYIVPTHISQMFSTHPATEHRIEALQDIAAEMGAAPAARRRSALDPLG